MIKIDVNKCIGCTQCVKDCPTSDIDMVNGKAHIKNESCLKCGHCIAVCPVFAVSTDDYDMNDIKPYEKENFHIDSDTFLNFLKFRRSIRQFKDKPIEADLLLKIIEAGRFSPSSLNSQDVNFIIVKDKIDEVRTVALEEMTSFAEKALKFQESSIIPEGFKHFATEKLTKIKKVSGIPKDLSQLKNHLAYVVEENKKYLKDKSGEDRLFFNAPTLIITTARNPLNAAIASANMELMIDTLGLGSFFASGLVQASHMNKKIHKILNISEDEEIVTCLAVGYPKVRYFRTTPKKAANIQWE